MSFNIIDYLLSYCNFTFFRTETAKNTNQILQQIRFRNRLCCSKQVKPCLLSGLFDLIPNYLTVQGSPCLCTLILFSSHPPSFRFEKINVFRSPQQSISQLLMPETPLRIQLQFDCSSNLYHPPPHTLEVDWQIVHVYVYDYCSRRLILRSLASWNRLYQ